jgi:hypothetical protein
VSNVLTIPVQAVVRIGSQSTVLVLDGQNRVQQRNVELGLQGTNLVEVKSGLSEGDQVIVGGQSNYQAGETVQPKLESLSASDVSLEQSGGGQ